MFSALIFAAALAVAPPPCPLCTPDGRLAVLAEAGAKSFDALQRPGRTLLRAIALDPSGKAYPVVTLIRDGDGAVVEAAGRLGRGFARAVSRVAFNEAEQAVKSLPADQDGSSCSGRNISVQVRFGEGTMSAIDNRGCDARVERVAERFAALALRAAPECAGAEGGEPLERLRLCLAR